MHAYDARHCRKTEPSARKLRSEEGIKDFGLRFFVHAIACIVDLQANIFARQDLFGSKVVLEVVVDLLHSRGDHDRATLLFADGFCAVDN